MADLVHTLICENSNNKERLMDKQILNVFRAGLLFISLPGLALAQHDAGMPQIEDI